uniref:Metabotropic gaba receptor n=1 Tax=Hormiphora californensis TaxID=1403702 RepID=A0A1S6WN83_HORCA|nr:metabotropic gaba receptor [Hormiphora californensis]
MAPPMQTILFLLLLIHHGGGKTPIRVGLFVPGQTGKSFSESWGLIPMGEVARDQINNSSDILPDYTLQTKWFNTQAEPGKAIHELFTFIGRNDTREYVGIVGPVFTDVTKYVSEMAPFFNYVSISPTASSSEFSEHDPSAYDESGADGKRQYIYRNSLRLHPVETNIYTAVFELAKLCDWEKVHILTGEGEMNAFRKSVVSAFDKEQLNLVRYSFTSSNNATIINALQQLKSNNARVIVANFDTDDAYDVFCEAYHRGFLSESPEHTGRRVWILPSSLPDTWIRNAAARSGGRCTKENILQAVGTYLTAQFQWNTTENELGTNFTFNETWESYDQLFAAKGENCSCAKEDKAGSLMYDSLWTLAMGLDRFLYHYNTSTRAVDMKGTVNSEVERAEILEKLLERQGNLSTELINSIKTMSFNGASGRIEFGDENDSTCRSGFRVVIQQLRITHNNLSSAMDYELVDVCESDRGLNCTMPDLWDSSIFANRSQSRECTAENGETGCKCPVDGPRVSDKIKKIVGIPFSSLVFFTISSIVGTILAVIFFVFNVLFMKERVIKMSSPHINNIILFGSLFLYSYVPLAGLMTGIDGQSLDASGNTIIKFCSVRILSWLLCLGFTISFGALFAKTWRVYAIFTSKKPRHIILSDLKLVVLIAGLVLVDVILLGVNEYLNRYTWDFRTLTDFSSNITMDELLDDTPDEMGELVCKIEDGKTVVPWALTVALIYKGVLLVFGAFIAFQSRNISIPALNDSKFIGISIYTILVVASIIFPVTMFLDSQPALEFAVQAAGILFTTTVTICLVFLPKAYQLRYQPKEAITNTAFSREWDSLATVNRRESEIQNLLKHTNSAVSLRRPPSRALTHKPSLPTMPVARQL